MANDEGMDKSLRFLENLSKRLTRERGGDIILKEYPIKLIGFKIEYSDKEK
ncbi:MAG: hypothetical protein ACI4F9_03800 [Lachnospiraceae bacterium]